MTRPLDHYDRFSFLIDLFRDWPYHEARAAAIGALHRMLPAGTRVALMEVYFERRSLACRVVDWIGAADCTRGSWEALEKRLVDYRRVDFPLQFSRLIVASGTKR
ncbi:MAG: hypothetical protein ACE5FL_02670 [Myxococcota bacterium]